MFEDPYDICIVGGGPAGCSAAMQLASGEYRVVLIEKRRQLDSKLCGEFLSPEGGKDLERLGLGGEVNHKSVSVSRFRLFTGAGRSVEIPLPDGALGISRHVLDPLLLKNVKATGTDVRQGWCVTDIKKSEEGGNRFVNVNVCRTGETDRKQNQVRAKVVLGAFGRWNRLDRVLERETIPEKPLRVAFKKHLKKPSFLERQGKFELSTVDLYSIRGGYCGVVDLPDHRLNVCLLTEQQHARWEGTSDWKTVKNELLLENHGLRRRLEGCKPSTREMKAVSPLSFRKKELYRDPVYYLGDAGCLIAPFTGDGMSMAIRSGMKAADLLLEEGVPEGQEGRNRLGQKWKEVWKTEFSTRIRAARLMQNVLRSETGTNALVSLAQVFPSLKQPLYSITRGGVQTSGFPG